MANPSPYIQLMAKIAQAEDNSVGHAEAIAKHTELHVQKRDAERNTKAAAKRAGTNTH